MDIDKLVVIRNQIDKMISEEGEEVKFQVSISDNFTEYQYPLMVDGSFSIDKIYSEICEHFDVFKCPGKER